MRETGLAVRAGNLFLELLNAGPGLTRDLGWPAHGNASIAAERAA